MTRHARNCTAGAVYTYHEKEKDSRSSGYGTQAKRIGKDSVNDFDCCCLTLQPCRNPVITPLGYLYDKEAILEYIISKKNEVSKQMKEYERQKNKEQTELAELAAVEKQMKMKTFLQREKDIISKPICTLLSADSSSGSVSNMAEGRHKNIPSFWLPSKTPEAKVTALKKPDTKIYCPMSGKALKVKDLIDVHFTEVKDPDDKKSLISKKNRYMCPVTHDVLGNAVPCAVLKPTGHVVTVECVETIIKKDMVHPFTSQKMSEKDIIPLQRGGTGYSGTNQKLEGKNSLPVLQA